MQMYNINNSRAAHRYSQNDGQHSPYPYHGPISLSQQHQQHQHHHHHHHQHRNGAIYNEKDSASRLIWERNKMNNNNNNNEMLLNDDEPSFNTPTNSKMVPIYLESKQNKTTCTCNQPHHLTRNQEMSNSANNLNNLSVNYGSRRQSPSHHGCKMPQQQQQQQNSGFSAQPKCRLCGSKSINEPPTIDKERELVAKIVLLRF